MYSGKLKPTKIVGILALLILSAYVVFILIQIVQSLQRYDSPSEAAKANTVLRTMVDDPFALVITQNGQAFEGILTYKDKKGWREIKNQTIVKDLKYRPYIVSYKKIENQYGVVISYHSESEFGAEIDPYDSLESVFSMYDCKNDFMYFRFWFVMIDEMPDNYVLYIGDQEIHL